MSKKRIECFLSEKKLLKIQRTLKNEVKSVGSASVWHVIAERVARKEPNWTCMERCDPTVTLTHDDRPGYVAQFRMHRIVQQPRAIRSWIEDGHICYGRLYKMTWSEDSTPPHNPATELQARRFYNLLRIVLWEIVVDPFMYSPKLVGWKNQ